jgi:hypothetical protein
MAAQHFDSSGSGGGSDHYTGALVLADDSRVGIARLCGGYALHIEPQIADDVVYLDRDEVRQLALTLIDASQHEEK